MEEGHNQAADELSLNREEARAENAKLFEEGSRTKISHAPGTRAEEKEKIKYSSDDILDTSMAGQNKNLFTNVKTPDPDFKTELDKTRATVRSRVDTSIKNPLKRLSNFFFGKDHQTITFSTLGAVAVALLLLTIPNLLTKPATNIDPETGYSEEEAQWLKFTDNIRNTISMLDYENPTEYEDGTKSPSSAVLTYFSELLEEYKGSAEQLDIKMIKAEYYSNFGLYEDAVGFLTGAAFDYEQPADSDPDVNAYFERMTDYYLLLIRLENAAGEEANAAEHRRQLDALLDEKIRVYNATHSDNLVIESEKNNAQAEADSQSNATNQTEEN